MNNWKVWIENLKARPFSALGLLILLAIPVTLILVFRSQDTRSKAAVSNTLAYMESGGSIVMEAETHDANVTNGTDHNWGSFSAGTYPVVGGTIYHMGAVPNNGALYYESQPSPELKFNIWVNNSGTYWVYLRTSGVDSDADSVHVGLDGGQKQNMGTYYKGKKGYSSDWSWDGANPVALNITTGFHTFSIWQREDGAKIDRIRLVQNPSWQPSVNHSDYGPESSPRQVLTTTGSLSANPNPCTIPWNGGTTCASTLSWTTNLTSGAVIRLSSGEFIANADGSGSITLPSITDNTYILYDGDGTELNRLRVYGTREPSPMPAGGPTGCNTFCSWEGGTCSFTGTREIAYGANGAYTKKQLTSPVSCSNATFGDPAVGKFKSCYVCNIASSPTPEPNTTVIKFQSIKLHGIGDSGDNANPNQTGNQNPKRLTRQIQVELIDKNTNTLPIGNADIIYRNSSGDFAGEIALPESFTTGDYIIKIKSAQYLRRQVSGIINIVQGTIVNIPPLTLITGDINNDNSLTISDYNLLIDCYSDLLPARNCEDPNKKLSADLSDDGFVNADDYNLFMRELSISQGD